jgi:hypothetical protein
MPRSTTIETRQIRGGPLDPIVVAGANVDSDVHALVTISVPHHEIHEGETFHVSRYVEGVADDASIIILLQLSTREAHATFAAAAGGDAEMQLIENPAINAAGTAMTEHNMNRHSTNVSTVVATHTPTLAGGTLLGNFLLPGGVVGRASGATARSNTEWILDGNDNYAIAIYNRSGQARNMSLAIQWYEETMA